MATQYRTKGKGDDRKVFPLHDSKGVKTIDSFEEKTEIEKAQKNASDKEKVKMLETMARTSLQDLSNITDADRLLDSVKHWSGLIGQYSSYNSLLIEKQNPNAKLVRSAKDWVYFGRRVKDDESGHGILVLHPLGTRYVSNGRVKKFIEDKRKEGLSDEHIMDLLDKKYPDRGHTYITHSFGVGKVYDITQTEKIPGSKSVDVDEDITANTLYDTMTDVVKNKFGLDYEELDYTKGERGYTDGQKISVLKIPNQDVSALNTIIHELAHTQLEHHKRKDYSNQSARGEMEAEAELTAYIVSSYYGFSDKMRDISLPYVKGWLSVGKFGEDNLDRVIRTAHKIVQATNETLTLNKAGLTPAEMGTGGA